MAIKTRRDLLDVETGINTKEIARSSRLVSLLTGYSVQRNKAIVGENAFSHESGIHQHGVLQDRLTYEIITAEEIGVEGGKIVLGKHSGRHAFAKTLEELGFQLGKEELNRAFTRFKELVDRKIQITDKDLEAIVADEIQSVEEIYALESLQVAGDRGRDGRRRLRSHLASDGHGGAAPQLQRRCGDGGSGSLGRRECSA
jgi:2-isopropylmalate synthase